jgi:hypothetical protein
MLIQIASGTKAGFESQKMLAPLPLLVAQNTH